MNQTTGVETLDMVLALVAIILTYAWIRGIVEPTPAALELLQQAHDDYNSEEARGIRERAAARAAYENQVAAAQRIRAQEIVQQRQETKTFWHRDSNTR